MAHKILMVEDDFALAMGTEYALTSEGYAVTTAGNLAQAREKFDDSIDHVLLDVMLPDGTGCEFSKELRADDYVTKPYRVKELLARVAVNIRRYTQARQTSQENSNRVVTFGNTAYDGEAFVLTQHGEKLDCTTSELRLLRFLLQHRGQVISRSAIMEQLYDIDGEVFEDNTLSVYIKRLRQKLGEDGAYIETVRGMGYRFRK